MTRTPVTPDLVHHLVTGSHAEGTTSLAVAAAIEHHERVLLIAQPGEDLDHSWELPTDLVLPGETLLDAVHRTVTCTTGLDIDQVTSYLGHHDRPSTIDIVRTFTFTATSADPERICRTATLGHRWTNGQDLPPGQISSGIDYLNDLAITPAAAPTGPHPQALRAGLRANAQGLYCAEAAVELIIGHRTWLRRNDFLDFVPTGPRLDGDTPTAFVDWPVAVTALHAGQLPCSGSDGRILRIAASLAAGIPVDLGNALTGLDTDNIRLVTTAILHANRGRQQ
jgi:ADP-ribose pyrophosphatase YjhB (NUDIX family)